MWWSILLGIGLGLSLAAPPGPMNALIARESSRHGAFAGVRVGLGAPVADVVFLLALVFGVGRFLDDPLWTRSAAAVGTLLMAYFAYSTFRPPAPKEGGPARPATFWAGFFAALTNPYQVAWWLSGGYVFLQAQGVWGIAGLLVGIFGWVLVFSWLVAHGARRFSWFDRVIQVASGFLLAVFAGLLLAVAIGGVAV